MTTPDDTSPDHPATRLLHAGAPALRAGSGPVNVPVVRTSTLRFESADGYDEFHRRRAAGERIASYGRHGLDTHRALEDALAELEGGERAFLVPSGLAAITLVFLALLGPGDHALVSDGVYAPLRRVDADLLGRLGIELEYFPPARNDLAARIRPNTRLLYLESPSSLLYEVLDLPALAALAQARGIPVAIDNTWGAGWFHRPLALGADISVQAATKYVAGHSDVMQGAVIARGRAIADKLVKAHDALGLTIGADDAYLALRGLRTLPVRLAQHQRNALAIARHLQARPEVLRVHYPALPEDPGHALWRRDFTGANGLVTFVLRTPDPRAAHRFVDALRLFGVGASWGGYESLALVAAPARLREHSAWDDAGPAVRLHVGLEDVEDLRADLDAAFGQLAAGAPDARGREA